MTKIGFDAAIFDLDGVITKTASVHSAAWKQMFDEFLILRAEKTGEDFREFSHTEDYLPFVDGKPRYKGVASFLDSRGIELPYGDPSDNPGQDTICGLGNRKNELFNEMIRSGKVEVFPSSVEFIRDLKRRGIRIGVASSSKNCKTILEAAGLTDLFETRVDGLVSAELNLQGKPEPDIFTTAADNLGATYDRTIVVEDAVSGVQAGLNGNFGLILGVAREKNERDLKISGADIVVKDLIEISFDDLERWFTDGLGKELWSLHYLTFTEQDEGLKEVLLTVGNGYFGTRGAMEETKADGIHYPGTYISGLYNRLESKVAGRTIVNEDFVNCPNWLPLTFKIREGDWFDPGCDPIVSIHRWLDFHTGHLHREMVVRDSAGRETRLESTRVASMAEPHLGAIRYCITPLNYSSRIFIKSGLDGDIVNAGVERYRTLNSKHLEPIRQGGKGNLSYLLTRTVQSRIKIAEAAKLILTSNGELKSSEIMVEEKPGAVWSRVGLEIEQGQSVTVDKIVALYTSKEDDVEEPLEEARKALQRVNGFDGLAQESASAWAEIWKKVDIQIEGDRWVQKLIRLNLYHSFVTASPHNSKLDAGIPARGLHGEAYRGHIFWDEMYILPLYNMHFPEVSKAVLKYRFRRLDQARNYAQYYGYMGAMFPWQSGSSGREETQVVHLNPLSGEWGPDYSSLQRHVSLAIAYNIWTYYWVTEDHEFMKKYGAEIFLEICRFWASKASYNEETGKYDIHEVMGPDEYHEHYPDRDGGGLSNNSYTNILVAWAFYRVFEILDLLDGGSRQDLMEKIHLSQDELEQWEEFRSRIQIPIMDGGLLEQFEGYLDLKELDWDGYRQRYGNIHRMDRILKAEGESPDEYKVSKQADTLMSFFVLERDGVVDILQRAGSPHSVDNLLEVNFEYYLHRTSHGSTLSNLVHAYLASVIENEALTWKFYQDALMSDYKDLQMGTTQEGIHVGVVAGSTVLTLRAFAGLRLDKEYLYISPNLPDTWRRLIFNLQYKGDHFEFELSPSRVEVRASSEEKDSIPLLLRDQKLMLENGQWETIRLR